MKDKKFIFAGILVSVFLLTVGLTYAYFSGGITGNDVAKDITVQMGNLQLFYDSGQEIKANNIEPGKIIIKEFTVTNTGDFSASFNINIIDMINTIEKDELVYTLTCEAFENYNDSSQKSLGECDGENTTALLYSKTPTSQIIKENNRIKTNITNKYTLTITFNETGSAQNYNQGKNFGGKIYIGDYQGPPIYKVTFNANGGQVDTQNVEVTYNTAYETLPTASREGYEFLGWFTDINEGEAVTESSIVSLAEDHTLYAHWKEIVLSYTNVISNYSCANAQAGDTADRVFSYTGNCSILNDDNGWRIKFTSSGTLRFNTIARIDAFIVGGGNAGGNGYKAQADAPGKGGETVKSSNITIAKDKDYSVVVGAPASNSSFNGVIASAGGSTTAAGQCEFLETKNGACLFADNGYQGHYGASGHQSAYGGGSAAAGGNCYGAAEREATKGASNTGAGGGSGNRWEGACNDGNGNLYGFGKYGASGGSGVVIIRNAR